MGTKLSYLLPESEWTAKQKYRGKVKRERGERKSEKEKLNAVIESENIKKFNSLWNLCAGFGVRNWQETIWKNDKEFHKSCYYLQILEINL